MKYRTSDMSQTFHIQLNMTIKSTHVKVKVGLEGNKRFDMRLRNITIISMSSTASLDDDMWCNINE